MFEEGRKKREKVRLPVAVQLRGQPKMAGIMFALPTERLVDLLNDDRSFLPFESGSGTTLILQKADIVSVRPIKKDDAAQTMLTGEPHQVLEIEEDASEDEIREAFKELVAEIHPDRVKRAGLHPALVETARTLTRRVIEARDEMLSALTEPAA